MEKTETYFCIGSQRKGVGSDETFPSATEFEKSPVRLIAFLGLKTLQGLRPDKVVWKQWHQNEASTSVYPATQTFWCIQFGAMSFHLKNNAFENLSLSLFVSLSHSHSHSFSPTCFHSHTLSLSHSLCHYFFLSHSLSLSLTLSLSLSCSFSLSFSLSFCGLLTMQWCLDD